MPKIPGEEGGGGGGGEAYLAEVFRLLQCKKTEAASLLHGFSGPPVDTQ